MNIKSLIEASEMSQTKFAQHLGIPLRTVQNWATNKNKCPDWTTSLIEFRLRAEGVIETVEATESAGEWIDGNRCSTIHDTKKCSCCGISYNKLTLLAFGDSDGRKYPNYCPNCGDKKK